MHTTTLYLCVSQDEAREFDVNLTRFAESIEKITSLPDRNHRSFPWYTFAFLSFLSFSLILSRSLLTIICNLFASFLFVDPSRLRGDFFSVSSCRVSKVYSAKLEKRCAIVYVLVHILAAKYRTNIANSVPAKTVSLVEKYLYLGYVLVAGLISRSNCVFSLDYPHPIFPNQNENWTALTWYADRPLSTPLSLASSMRGVRSLVHFSRGHLI